MPAAAPTAALFAGLGSDGITGNSFTSEAPTG
jgi:hypothetical protein